MLTSVKGRSVIVTGAGVEAPPLERPGQLRATQEAGSR